MPFSLTRSKPVPAPKPANRNSSCSSQTPQLTTQPQPLRPSMTPPNPPHSHTTRSTRQSSAKASLMSVLSSGVNANHQEKNREDSGDSDGSGSGIYPGIASSSASFVSTSTSSTNLLTPPLLDSPPLTSNNTLPKFDQLHIPSSSHTLPDNLLAILEKPLLMGHGVNGGYGFSSSAAGNTGGLGGGNITSVVGTGKSGNRHSEFGWDTNQNWRYTSQVR